MTSKLIGTKEVARRLDTTMASLQKKLQRYGATFRPAPCMGPPWKWRERDVDDFIASRSLSVERKEQRQLSPPSHARTH